MKLELMDTTLRDGEQTSGVSFTPTEKLNIARLLIEELKIDRVEVASARVSEGEFEGVQRIVEWAEKKQLKNKIEVLGFVDGKNSIDWINRTGAQVMNLLCKGSLNHLKGQLRKTPQQHIDNIKQSIEYANKLGIEVNVYLEDWSNGMINSRDYVFYFIDNLKDANINRFMLPDTLGILNPYQTHEFCRLIVDKYPELYFDFHAHNDYGLAAANVLAAAKAGIHGIHTTVNGLGERAGNAALSTVIAVLKDQFKGSLNVDESKINKISYIVQSFSGIRIPTNEPIIGEHVFTQTCGVHADGDNKNNLYFNDLLPERFGRTRKYALGKTAGKANIMKNLQEIGIEISPEATMKVTQRVIELGDKKESVTTEDLPFIISDVLKSEKIKQKIKIKNYSLNLTNGLQPVATLSIEIENKIYEETAIGDGQYDAFMNALEKIYQKLGKKLPELLDYWVTIPPGGKTDALVETVITWKNDKEFKTRGLSPDQTLAAIKATIKMLNIIENETMNAAEQNAG